MLATTSIVATVPSNVQLAITSPSCRPSHAGAPDGGGGVLMSNVDFKKMPMSHVDLKKCPCRPVTFKGDLKAAYSSLMG